MNKMLKKIYYSKWFPRLFFKKYDGGPDSGVTGYMLIEWKILFSIGLLHFKEGSREAYHTHAFNAITWWIKGSVTEELVSGRPKDFAPSFKPKITKRSCFHKVIAKVSSWAFTIRGPWKDKWYEFRNNKTQIAILTHGRKVLYTTKIYNV